MIARYFAVRYNLDQSLHSEAVFLIPLDLTLHTCFCANSSRKGRALIEAFNYKMLRIHLRTAEIEK